VSVTLVNDAPFVVSQVLRRCALEQSKPLLHTGEILDGSDALTLLQQLA
jgi:hypothetical protein